MKQVFKERLREKGVQVLDYGTSCCESVDYPDIALPVARAVATGEADRGVLICGTGIGMSIAANKVRGVRAALCHDVFSARVTREHNDANVLCMGARVIGPGLALEILETWLGAGFSGGRHVSRVKKVTQLDDLRDQ
jgi:ribose 5-phosphate isomerase B